MTPYMPSILSIFDRRPPCKVCFPLQLLITYVLDLFLWNFTTIVTGEWLVKPKPPAQVVLDHLNTKDLTFTNHPNPGLRQSIPSICVQVLISGPLYQALSHPASIFSYVTYPSDQ